MSLDKLRNYARRTARELQAAGVAPVTLTQVTVTYRTVTTSEGWIFKRTVTTSVPESTTRTFRGWPVWSQQMTIVETRPPSGWTVVEEIWLTADGGLLQVVFHRNRWGVGASAGMVDTVESVREALDSDVRFADWPFYPMPRSPRVPRNARTGRFESDVGHRRNAKPLPEGMRVSQGITALRKAKGTYVQRRDR